MVTLSGVSRTIITLLAYFFCLPKGSLQGPHERRLLNHLLEKYHTLERPVANESDALQLSFGLTLMQIIDVAEKNQLLLTTIWLRMEWDDVNLKWNESEYGNIGDLRIPPHRIWKPDLLMYNSADEGFDRTYATNVVVKSNGRCTYIPPGIFKSTCRIDITWFPFDEQKCEMKFGSWTYNGFQLDLQLQSEEGGDISSFIKNGEWELKGVPGKRTANYYTCCPEPYVDITFVIHIQRRTIYYFFNLIAPCVLIASMAVLGFTLPPDSGEKLSLGVTILLSLTLFLDMVAETMPETSDAVPLLGTYFNCMMFMVASSVVSTILILNYHHRSADTHEMSNWIRVVFLQWLPWVLRMNRPGEKITLMTMAATSEMQEHIRELERKERSSKSLLANVLDMDDDFRPANIRTPGWRTHEDIEGPTVSHHHQRRGAHRELSLILTEMRMITDKIRRDEEAADIKNDWMFAAMVVDRLCLIVFTLFTIIATLAVLASAPQPLLS